MFYVIYIPVSVTKYLLNMKYGFTTSFDELEQTLVYAAANNLTYLEISLSSNSNMKLSDEWIMLIRRAAKLNIGLNFHLPFTISIADIIPAIRKKSVGQLKNIIKLAGTNGIECIVIHPGIFYWFPVEKWTRKKALLRLINSLLQTVEYCREYNVKLALENVVPIPHGSDYLFIGDCVSDFQRIFERVDSDFIGFCLDTGHANLAEGSTSYIDKLKEKLINVHFHDNLGKNDNHLSVGEGNINWTEVCSALDSIKYNGPLISESSNVSPVKARENLECYFKPVRSTTLLL